MSARIDGSTVDEFNEANGRLRSAGRLNGFTICNARVACLPLVFFQRISAANPNAVELFFAGKLPPGAAVWYGQGKDPCVNPAGEAGMAAAVFGHS